MPLLGKFFIDIIKGFAMPSPKVTQVFLKHNDGYPSTTQKRIHREGYVKMAAEVGMLQPLGAEWTSEADRRERILQQSL